MIAMLKTYRTRRNLKKQIELLKKSLAVANAKVEEISRERDRWMSQTF